MACGEGGHITATDNDRIEVSNLSRQFLFRETNNGMVARSILTAGAGTPPLGLNSLAFRQKTEIKSGYGQLDFKLTDRLSLVAGARYSDESKDGSARSYRRTGAGTGAWTNFAPSIGTHLDLAALIARSNAAQSSAEVPYGNSWTNWGGKVGLNFKVNDEIVADVSLRYGAGHLVEPMKLTAGKKRHALVVMG